MAYFGISDVSKIYINGGSEKSLNWTEINVPEIFTIPELKPDIENIDQVYADIEITSTKLIETPFAYEETCLCTVATPAQLAAAGTIADAVDALDLAGVFTDSVLDLIQALLDTLTADVLVEALRALGISLTVPGLIQTTLDSITALITSIDTLLTSLTTAAGDDTTTVCTLTTLLTQLSNLLTQLLSLVATLLQQLNDLLAEINSIISIPGVGILLNAVLLTLQTLLGTVTPLINALTTSLEQILTSIAALLGTLCPNCIKLLPNEEGTILTGRKLIIEGVINQKIVYTALVDEQSVHSAHYCFPFSAFVIPYAKFVGLTYNLETNCFSYTPGQAIIVDLNEDFNVIPYIEDIFAYAVDTRTIFKNVTIFLKVQSQI